MQPTSRRAVPVLLFRQTAEIIPGGFAASPCGRLTRTACTYSRQPIRTVAAIVIAPAVTGRLTSPIFGEDYQQLLVIKRLVGI